MVRTALSREALTDLARTNDTLSSVESMLSTFRAVCRELGPEAAIDLIEVRYSGDAGAAARLRKRICPDADFVIDLSAECIDVGFDALGGRSRIRLPKGAQSSAELAIALSAIRASTMRPPDWVGLDAALDRAETAANALFHVSASTSNDVARSRLSHR